MLGGLLVTVFDVYDLPAICEITLLNVFSEGNGRVTVDRNIWESHFSTICDNRKTPTNGCHPRTRKHVRKSSRSNDKTHGNKVSELQVSRETARFARDTFHQAAIPKDCYSAESMEDHAFVCRMLTICVIVDEVESISIENSP